MKNNLPKVSVVIPVYNGSNFMREAIDSALAQTYPNTEVIVVNDGSTDNGKTDKIARSYGNKIRYFVKRNGGVSSAINYGIKKMRGEYFSWLSHDDIYCPNKVATEIDYLKNHKLLGRKFIAYSNYCLIDKRNREFSEIILNHELLQKKPMYALFRGAINGNTLLIPKSAWDTYGGLDAKLKCTQDYEKWFEMSQTYQFVHVPKSLIKSRSHASQVTNTSPLVRTEGNDLWLKLVKSQNEKDRIKLNGSNYAYYYYLIDYLKKTPYDKALHYCEEQIQKYPAPNTSLPPENYVTYGAGRQLYSDNKIIKFFQFVNREGFKNTLRRIHKKLARKS